jgi:hypothetical protein
MKAEVPYLARLARQAAGQAMLWPPRQLFTGEIGVPARWPDRGGSPRRHVTAATGLPGPLAPAATGDDRIEAAHGVGTGEERWAGLEPASAASAAPLPAPGAPTTSAAPPSAPGTPVTPATSTAPPSAPGTPVTPATSTAPGAAATPVTSAWPEPAGLPVTPGRPDMHEPPQAAPRRRRTSSSGPPAAGPANPARTGLVPPGEPPAASSLPPAGGTGRARPPESWVSPLWGAPVDLPEALKLAPVADEAARRAVSASPAGPAAPPSGPGTAVPAGSRPGQRADDAGTSVARGAAGHREPGAGRATAPDRPRELTPVRDLMPPPASRTGPATMPGTEPGEPYREPRAPGRPYLSIGTIEVTVVPPAPPAAAGREAQPSPPVTPRWSRPPSLLASSAGRDRLRDGLRRWYGTAQG